MNIIESVKSLRDKTHLSMALCKKALDEANGDVSKAVEILQKSGEVKRIDENSKSSEGIVKGYKFPDKKLTVILGLSCQTDFAAKSPLFQEAMDKIANKVEGSSAGQDFKDDIEMLSKQLGEVIQIKSLNRLKTMERLNPESEKIEVMDYHVYNHFTNKVISSALLYCY